VNWYRVFADGVPCGWQAKKPDGYRATPYLTAAIDPFDSELIADEILWPEGEKDVDSLNSINLPAFTFGGVGDGLKNGIGQYLKDRRLVILPIMMIRGAHMPRRKPPLQTPRAPPQSRSCIFQNSR
jgi:putative DNA primase/helicase